MKKIILSTITILILFLIFAFVYKDKNSDNINSYPGLLVVNSKKLDANTISTWYSNNGSFNRDTLTRSSGFIWPKGTMMTARYASGLWMGAIVGGDTLIAMAEYDYEFLPGYTDSSGIPQGKDDPLYRTYKLTYGFNDAERLSWPNALLGNSNQGAPVYYDNQSNSWKPLDFGSQTMYYCFTDSYPEAHVNRAGSTMPLKADIKQVNFSVDGMGWIGNTIFTQYTIINRSTQIWNNAYISIWSDDDLGEATDDEVGCDSAGWFGYTYNGDNNDGIYGAAPPAVGFLLLKGGSYYTGNNNDTLKYCYNKSLVKKAGYKDRGMSSFNWNQNSNLVYGDPRIYYETYRYIIGLMRDGNPVINPIGNFITKYWYSGDPVTNTGWVQNDPDDQRLMISTGPVTVNPGDTQIIIYAQIIGRGSSNLNSITILRQNYAEAKNYYINCSPNPIGIQNNSEVVSDFRLYQNYPNPFNPTTKIKFDVRPPLNPLLSKEGTDVFLKVYDVLGREVATLVNEQLKPGTYEVQFDGSNYASGVYYYQLVVNSEQLTEVYKETKRMVLIK